MKRKPSYHRGNLKQELLDAAVGLIAETGVQAFTLREVARRAAVSHNAPYRHFEGKDDLIAAVATQGFERLTESMLQSMSKATDAEERFDLCGRGYLQFALRWPQHIQVMFDLPGPKNVSASYKEAWDRAFQTLLACVVALQTEGKLPPGDPNPFAILAWSTVHGFAKLTIAGRLPFNKAQALNFADTVLRTLKHGILHQPSEAV